MVLGYSIPYVERQKKVDGYFGEGAILSEEKRQIIELQLYYSKCDCSWSLKAVDAF